jgi:hypothetical protein
MSQGRSSHSYPLDTIYEEVAFIAYHFHWSYEEIVNLDHTERRRWCREISKINERLNQELEKKKLH